jgi:hypothetical protein
VPAPGRLVAAAALLAVWLGAGAAHGGRVAPAAFAVLPTRALAGALVGRVLPVIFVGGIAAGAAAAALGGAAGGFGRPRLVLAVATAVLCAVAQFGVTPAHPVAPRRDRARTSRPSTAPTRAAARSASCTARASSSWAPRASPPAAALVLTGVAAARAR